MKNNILVIAGPTAVGKTSLAINLAKELNGEVVSADSMQVYVGLDIGTAKPTIAEREGIPHHMIDVCTPDKRYSVAQYVKGADEVITDILSRGKLPIIAGGTGLYIDNLITCNHFSEIDIDSSVRSELMMIAESKGGEYLLNELVKVDPEYASRLHPNDIKRIVHALELIRSTGKTHSCLIEESRAIPSKYNCLYAVLSCTDRDILYSRINRRVDVMLDQGLLDEAKQVISSAWYVGSTASQAIGYKEFESYINGNGTLNEAVELLKRRSRNYAKRQLTWFRHREAAKFYFVDAENDIKERIMRDFLDVT